MNAVILQETGKLPANYENACKALAECSRVDECQMWADKAAAIASYARQADDETLHRYADRVKARAIRRGGELLKQVEPGKNRFDRQEGDLPSNRKEAADSAGLSEHQRKTMLRVASVPQEEFERQVESDTPPTITALAEQGKKPSLLGSAAPQEFKYATHALATLRRFAEFASVTDAASVVRGIQPSELSQAMADVATVDAWLDSFMICATKER